MREPIFVGTPVSAERKSFLQPGDMLGGFRVDDVIGIGGMAIVYRAEQVSLGRPVALKVLSRHLTIDETFKERFRREGKHAAALEHPNIVPVYDSGEQDGQLYIAMRLVEGTNLAEMIPSGLSADRAIEILGPIAGALDSAHAAGLIHRDVKPQNMLITDGGHPYLADFGVAKGSNTLGLTATGGFLGSVNYASPEQIRGLTLTPASDIYALTAVLYHCLTGTVPYSRDSDAGIMHAHLNEPPPALPPTAGADCELHTVLARGMAKDPGARYGHAGDLLNAAALAVSRMPSDRRRSVPAFAIDGASSRDRANAKRSSEPAKDGTELVSAQELANARAAAAMTTADRRRAVVAPRPAGDAPARRRRRLLIPAASALAVLAALAIVLVAASGRGVAAKTASRGAISLRYASPWRAIRGLASSHGLTFEDPIALGRAGATLIAGAILNAAAAPGGLPPGIGRRLDRAPVGQSTTIGSVQAVQYDATAEHGVAAVVLAMVPTATGDLGLLCAATRRSAMSSCMDVAQTLRLTGVHVVRAGPDLQLQSGLVGLLGPLASLRSRAERAARLHVSHMASGLSAADAKAAARAARLSPEPRDRPAVKALVDALVLEADRLHAAAAAAHARRRSAYLTATRSVTSAGRRLVAAIAELSSMGFKGLPVLAPIALPALPAVHRRPQQSSAASSAAPVEQPPIGSTPVSPPASSTPAPRPGPVTVPAKPLS